MEREAIWKPRRGVLEESKPGHGQLDLGFLASRTVRNVFLIGHPVCGILLWQFKKINTVLDFKAFPLQ